MSFGIMFVVVYLETTDGEIKTEQFYTLADAQEFINGNRLYPGEFVLICGTVL